METELEQQFSCRKCGATITVQGKPDKCVCGEKDNFTLLSYVEDEVRIKLGETYEHILQVLDVYMDMPENSRKVIATWIIGTYIHETFNTYPFIFLNATKGSGKTRLLKLISSLSRDSIGEVQSGISEAVFFRTPKHTTLIIDECEGIGKKDAQALREYMQASYKQGATVSRTKRVRTKEGEDYQIQKFEPYRPLAMANIWGMDEVLGDRCITLILEKSNSPGKTKLIEDFENNDFIKLIKNSLKTLQCSLCSVVTSKNNVKWWNNYILMKYSPNNYTKLHYTLTTHTTLTTQQQEFFNKIDLDNIDGRNLELFMPLFLVSELLNEESVVDMIKIAKEIVNTKKEEDLVESRDANIYQFIAIQNLRPLEFISMVDLTRSFKEYIGEVEDDDKWINTKYMGRALKRLNLVIEKKRMARGVQVILNVDKAIKQVNMFKSKLKEEKKDEKTL